MIFKWFLSKKSNQSLLVQKTTSLKRRRKKNQNVIQLIGIMSFDSCLNKINRDQESKTLYRLPEMKTREV